SDKCYENVEWPWGYRENDTIGGKDIYSGSKGAAEVIFHAFHCSFFNKTEHPVKVASARAGNVIGGGDWAQDRIVADAMRAWSRSTHVVIRSPDATRPWQHVLEPVGGYLILGQVLSEKPELSGESFNFGPPSDQTYTVKQLLEDLSLQWGFKDPHDSYRVTDRIPFHEAGLLKLNCDKAKFSLKWTPTLEYRDTIRLVSEWYVGFYQNQINMLDKTQEQIAFYTSKARDRGHIWARK
ncbi:MAG: CDP-glucose 4,6-dehydratase, partial [Pseudobdellovibrionaceae bacterium]|nr:CDP-glucose 4,6-dehydratase [Pseudobdellovibrionaceae bacterium]